MLRLLVGFLERDRFDLLWEEECFILLLLAVMVFCDEWLLNNDKEDKQTLNIFPFALCLRFMLECF